MTNNNHGFSFDTFRFRVWWSVFGIALWIPICIFATIDKDGLLWKLFMIALVGWTISIFVIMGKVTRDHHRAIRDLWKNYPDQS